VTFGFFDMQLAVFQVNICYLEVECFGWAQSTAINYPEYGGYNQMPPGA